MTRILVVEDEMIVALDIEETLRRLGYSVAAVVSTGEEAVRKADELKPDVVLMDIQLKGSMDGIEAARRIAEKKPVPVVFLTAYADTNTISRAKLAFPYGYILKPFEERELYSALEVAIHKGKEDSEYREQAEDALFQSEERYRLLLESVHEYGIYMLDMKGNIVSWNSGAERLTGYSATEIMGRNHACLYPPEDQQLSKPEAALRQAALNGTFTEEGVRVRKDGTRFWAEAVHSVVRNKAGEHKGYAKVLRDITQKREIERQKAELLKREQQARQEAERLNIMKDEFLQTLSHELRTPLTPILGWSRIVLGGMYDRETVEKAMRTIDRNTKAEIALIEDLLDISRIVNGKVKLDFKPIALAQVIEQAVETVRPTAAAKNIEITFSSEATGAVLGDASRLQQVFWNLLHNAVKFSDKSAKVEVSLKNAGSTIIAEVKDTGRGIPPEFLPYVFARFTQADSSMTRSQGGLGLGLSIVKHLIEMHGGTVAARSEGIGKGSSFTVELPAAAEVQQPPVYPMEDISTRLQEIDALRNRRILIVDDQEDARDFLAFLFTQWGAVPIAAASAQEALLEIDRGGMDLVITDIGMPETNGYELLSLIRARDPKIPVVAVTAFAGTQDRQHALKLGFQEHISKPVDPAYLAQKITQMFEQQRPAS
ncbi:MAG TPA: response regulator [Planctomycetota bacterium]|nr:response regulator [Planctomycetota bacterium]